jgi:DNA-binding XRE family transcriptional regulator
MKLTLKAARVNAKFTQAEAAEKLECSKASLSNYETGKTIPDMMLGAKMAKLYGVQIDDFTFLKSISA